MYQADKIADYAKVVDAAWYNTVDQALLKEDYAGALKTVDKNKSDGAAAKLSKAKVHLAQGQTSEAKAAAKEALTAFRDKGQVSGEASTLLTSAKIYLDSAGFDETQRIPSFVEADRLTQEALTLFKSAGLAAGEAGASLVLAKVCLARDQIEDAYTNVDKALASFKELSDKEGIAAALITKATVVMAMGDLDQTATLASEAVAACKEVGSLLSKVLQVDALLLQCSGSFPKNGEHAALAAAKEALSISETLGGDKGVATALRAVAFCHATVGDAEEAVRSVEAAVTFANKTGDKHLQATVSSTATVIYHARLKGAVTANAEAGVIGEYEKKAQLYGDEAMQAYTETGDKNLASLVMMELAQVKKLVGNMSSAAEMLSKAQKYFEDNGEMAGEGMCYLALAEITYLDGNSQAALGAAKKAQDLFKNCGATTDAIDAAAQAVQAISKEASMMQTKESWGSLAPLVHMGDPADRGVSKAIYTRIYGTHIKIPDMPGETLSDAPIIAPLTGGSTHAAHRASVGSKPASKPVPTAAEAIEEEAGQEDEGPKVKTGGPSEATKARKKMLERLSRPPLVSKEAAPPGGFVQFDDQEVGAQRSLTSGEDVLGGRAWDCTEALHSKMLEYAMRGDIPITKPEQRARLARKKPTFHGAPAWRDAVKMGYIHPDIAPPKGYSWKRVSIGWKLLEGN